MSRRHYNKLQQEPLPPFAENLVFWAPLTEGDLTDHINEIVPNIQGSATWDGVKGMYILDSTLNSQWKAALQYTKEGGYNINALDGWTLFGYFEIVYSSWDYNVIMASTSSYIRNNGWSTKKECFAYMNEHNVGVLSGKHKLCMTAKVNLWIFYVDGVQVGTSAGYTYEQQINPPTKIDICSSNTGRHKIQEYANDVRVYNRALTASEVAQL